MTCRSTNLDRPVTISTFLRSLWSRARGGKRGGAPPLGRYDQGRNPIRFVDLLSDEELQNLNALLPWKCFVVDRHGRRFGDLAWRGKRQEPQVVPDRRIDMLHQRFALADKHVLEVGCFEGVHTAGLCQYAGRVTAVDGRIENVVKSIVRCTLWGYHPTIFQCDLEQRPLPSDLLSADVVFHVGVLYHLADPVRHLLELGGLVRRGVLLDTHYALNHETHASYSVDGREVTYKRYREGGRADPFSGIYDHAKWLTLSDIVDTLRAAGFSQVDIMERREERNGPRVLLIAERS